MAVLSEGRHAGEFIVSEVGQISRETVTIKQGEKLVPGTILELDDDGKAIAFTGTDDVGGELIREAAGILFAAVDASATGANADVPGPAIVARLAEVNGAELTFPAETDGERARAIASLAARNIIVR